ncbi:helix-turn-helix domain-containing protein [Streptomyces phaeochromogenes]|uniref:helix-turn-helix domain-containing protein n=1 Tax=Streptomyces phaeochromogenes TaxID=1923 RepID=UPI003716E4F0
MSTRTFGRRFAAEVGLTPLKWLNQQRLARARELLETTDLGHGGGAERAGQRGQPAPALSPGAGDDPGGVPAYLSGQHRAEAVEQLITG